MLEEKINSVKQKLIDYATLIENMMDKCIRGVLEKEKSVLDEVIEKDEPRVNELEIEFDEICTNLIVQYEPRAKDLRTLLMILKMNNDLERLGDHAVNIAQSGLFLIENPQVKPLIDIPIMSEIAIKMFKDSVTSFIKEDVELARDVCKRDNEVDNLKDKVLRELIAVMTSDPQTIERSLHLLRISSNLERVADLSTNIAEEVIYLTAGKVIKHHQDEKNTK